MLVNGLDSIGETVANPRYLVYLEGDNYSKYGTNNIKGVDRSLVPYLLMRQFNINRCQARDMEFDKKPNLIITDMETGLDLVYEYKVLN